MFTKKDNLIEIICGPMFAGKTEKLINIIQQLKKFKQKTLVFKSQMDQRFSSKKELVSHNNKKIHSLIIDKSKEILNFVVKDTQFIIIDEVQFLDNDIIDIVDNLANNNIKIIMAGLELDFRGKPFGPMPQLLAIADNIIKLKGICAVSGKPANRTQRLIDKKPANINDPIVLTEKDNPNITYEPRARQYHQIINK